MVLFFSEVTLSNNGGSRHLILAQPPDIRPQVGMSAAQKVKHAVRCRPSSYAAISVASSSHRITSRVQCEDAGIGCQHSHLRKPCTGVRPDVRPRTHRAKCLRPKSP